MAEIIIIGSSSGYPSPDRASAGILLKTSGRYYQFDAGDGCSASLKRLKIDHSMIRVIFITHLHADHIAGLFLELQMMHLTRRKAPLSIYLPSEGREAVENFLNTIYLFTETLGFECYIKPVIPDPVYRDDSIAVYARLNTHLQKYRAAVENGGYTNKMESYSYVIKTKTRKLIYSGDVGSSDDYADLLTGCDILITEGMHVTLDKLFADVAQNNVSQLLLTHLTEEVYRNPLPLRLLAKKYRIEHLHIVNDGYSLKI